MRNRWPSGATAYWFLVVPGTVVHSDMSKIIGRVNVDPEVVQVAHRSDATQVVEVNAVRGRVNITTT